MKKTINMIMDKVDSLLIGISILLIFTSFEFYDMNINGGWYQQSIPDLGGASINDITFLDSLTGFAVTNQRADSTGFILKTTNGGDNWFVSFIYRPPYDGVPFNRIKFYNDSCCYVSADYPWLYKTTNRGITWDSIYTGIWPQSMEVLNKDTILFVKEGGFNGGLYRTTNGGNSWHYLYDFGPSYNPNKIYMYNKDIGFVCVESISSQLYKTTNGGLNWFVVPGNAFRRIFFADTLIGWKSFNIMKKTTDGANSWLSVNVPPEGGQILTSGVRPFSVINLDTLFGYGGVYWFPNNQLKGMIYKSTDGGLNWGYQIPDTSFGFVTCNSVNFVDRKHGWAYKLIDGIHTTTGGSDTTIYTGIVNNYQTINDFILEQNYPNPFNSITNIKFKMLNSGFAEIKVYDITGKLIKVLTSKKYELGEHTVRFDASELPSGVYFYKLEISGDNGKIYSETRKMILVK
ncbi:MAG: T9SS type A sorting domain-containing protein [Ignavibacteria bacterium]|nr:T9SS type A sorting domain-containing protein [Ignavibacteria bacterium]